VLSRFVGEGNNLKPALAPFNGERDGVDVSPAFSIEKLYKSIG
jgi:hypothetical protein